MLVLDEMGSAGLATLRELGAAVERVRGAGKPVMAWSESYTQGQYFLAAHADEVFMHPSGALLIRGIGGTRGYYKELLDKLGVKVNTFQAGRYKSFRRALHSHRTDARGAGGGGVPAQRPVVDLARGRRAARKLKAGSVMAAINDLPQRLQATEGDLAQLALKEKLIDGLKRRDEFRALMFERGAPRSR